MCPYKFLNKYDIHEKTFNFNFVEHYLPNYTAIRAQYETNVTAATTHHRVSPWLGLTAHLCQHVTDLELSECLGTADKQSCLLRLKANEVTGCFFLTS